MKKNFIYNTIYQILILILPLITIPYVSRVLQPEGLGIYTYTYSIVYYFMIIAMLGIGKYGNRKIAKARDNVNEMSKEFISIYSLQIIMSILMLIAYFVYILIFDNQYKDIAFIQGLYIFSSMFDINWFFFGLEKFKLTITRNTLIKVLSLILVFVFVKTKEDVWIYTLILSGSTLFSNLVLFAFLKKYVKFVKIKFNDIKEHIKPCMILFLPVIAVTIYKVMDKNMLGAMADMNEVGYYENAEKIVQVPIAIITAMGTIMLPRVSNMISNNKEEEVKNIIGKTIPFMMFMAFPMMMGILAISNDFSVAFFGDDFQKSGILIQLLVITIIFLAWGDAIRNQYLIPKEKDREFIISAFLGAVVNFILNFVLIPKYAAVGACIGTIVAEFCVMFYQTWVVRKELSVLKYIKSSILFFIKAIIMLIVVLLVGMLNIPNIILKIILQMLSGITIYGILNIKYIFNIVDVKKYKEKFLKNRKNSKGE